MNENDVCGAAPGFVRVYNKKVYILNLCFYIHINHTFSVMTFLLFLEHTLFWGLKVLNVSHIGEKSSENFQ